MSQSRASAPGRTGLLLVHPKSSSAVLWGPSPKQESSANTLLDKPYLFPWDTFKSPDHSFYLSPLQILAQQFPTTLFILSASDASVCCFVFILFFNIQHF